MICLLNFRRLCSSKKKKSGDEGEPLTTCTCTWNTNHYSSYVDVLCTMDCDSSRREAAEQERRDYELAVRLAQVSDG